MGDISTGASNDIQRATVMAKNMVVSYGMSDEIGPIYLGGDQEVSWEEISVIREIFRKNSALK